MRSVLVLLLFAPLASAAPPWRDYARKPDDWYRSTEGRAIADAILSQQSTEGIWPKNTDTTEPSARDAARPKGTFDNGATVGEVRFLARSFRATMDPKHEAAFLKAIDTILKAQYANGGWPQTYPPGKGYDRHITFNDNTMINLMKLLREVAASDDYSFVDAKRRSAARTAFDRGIDCILKCQVVVDGKKTVWCAQHDEVDLKPRPARTYELISLSGSESVEIVRLLMSIDRPAPEVVAAIDAAVVWFESAKLTGIRQTIVDDPKAPRGKNKVVVKDPAAPPMWARFYEIGTNRPIYCDRDGIAKRELSEIGYERRNGYSWLGTWPADLLARDVPAWKARLALTR